MAFSHCCCLSECVCVYSIPDRADGEMVLCRWCYERNAFGNNVKQDKNTQTHTLAVDSLYYSSMLKIVPFHSIMLNVFAALTNDGEKFL